MKIYLYNKETLIYEGEREAILDIFETEKQGKEVYAKPFNATFTELPKLKDGQTAKYNKDSDSWIIVASNVGKYVINTKLNGVSKIIADRPIRSYEILITEEQYKDMIAHPDKYEISDNELIDISGTQNYQNKVNIKKYENLIRTEKEKYDKFLNTPVRYKGAMYLPRYLDDYEKLISRMFPQEIWDAEGLTSKVMTKADLTNLMNFLDELIRKAFKEKKENIKRYKLAIKKLEG